MHLPRQLAKLLAKNMTFAANRVLRFAEPPRSAPPLQDENSLQAPHDKAIVVTTFSRRFFSDCLPLVEALRKGQVVHPIYVVINADFDGLFDPRLRTTFLRHLSTMEAIFPICCGRPLGMAALWNLGIRQAGTRVVAVLNDDLSIDETLVGDCLDVLFREATKNHLAVLNDSFGHFAISKTCINTVGWFDERFLGFGQEDGDYVWRFEEYYGFPVARHHHGGLSNRDSVNGWDSHALAAGAKTSRLNLEYLKFKYVFGPTGTHKGMFQDPASRRLPEIEQCPGESWRDSIGHLLSENDSRIVQSELRKLFSTS